MEFHIEKHNLDGRGPRNYRVFDLTALDRYDYWASITDVQCPACETALLRWAEAGYVPGYRICQGCGRHFYGLGCAAAPRVALMGQRRGRL